MSTQATTRDLIDAVQRIRTYANDTRLNAVFTADPVRWTAICAAMDNIEDVCGVLEAFEDRAPSDDWRPRLLAIYGVLQAMFTQQHSLKSLADALGHPLTKDEWKGGELEPIREMRNRAIGHPSDFNPNQPKPGGHVVQASIAEAGFVVMIVEGATFTDHRVSIPDLVHTQISCVTSLVNVLGDKLAGDDRRFKLQFRGQTLASVMNCSGYYCRRVHEAIRTDHSGFGQMHVDLLSKQLDKAEAGIVNRFGALKNSDSLCHVMAETKYALKRLTDHFTSPLPGQDADVFEFFLAAKVRELEGMLNEVDEGFATDAEGNPFD